MRRSLLRLTAVLLFALPALGLAPAKAQTQSYCTNIGIGVNPGIYSVWRTGCVCDPTQVVSYEVDPTGYYDVIITIHPQCL